MEPSERPHCEACGMIWTPNPWRPPDPYVGSVCDCSKHEAPSENERRQHRLGRHNYRAWSFGQAEARKAELDSVRR